MKRREGGELKEQWGRRGLPVLAVWDEHPLALETPLYNSKYTIFSNVRYNVAYASKFIIFFFLL